MDIQLLKHAEKSQIRTDHPQFEVGDTIAVQSILREKGKQRLQTFKGIVLAIKNSGIRRTFTIRKISSGIGVEKIYPLHSPNIKQITFLKKGKVRRSKLYYMRERIGKKATKIDEGVLTEGMKKQHEGLAKAEAAKVEKAAKEKADAIEAKKQAEAEAKKAEEDAAAAAKAAETEVTAAKETVTEVPAEEAKTEDSVVK